MGVRRIGVSMQEWISQNWLALYGSIVGTVALLINVSRFIYSLKKDKVKLSLEVVPHPNRDTNIQRLKDTENKHRWEVPHLVEVYLITIRNLGTVEAYIEDASIVCEKGKNYSASISYANNSSMLGSISQVGAIKIAPKSSEKISVYLRREDEEFIASKVEVIDSTGKKWRKSA